MKTKTILVGVIAALLVLSIAFSGVALAAQTSFNVAVNDGTARVQTSFRSTTEGDVPPYDETGYKYNLYGIHGDVMITHEINTDGGVEAQNHVSYVPENGLKRIFLDEKVNTARVAKGDNFSVCCDSSAETRFLNSIVNYESAAISENNNLLFVVNAAGVGKGNILTQEGKQIGNENGTWTDSQTSDRLSVTGLWNISAEFYSPSCDYPALAPDKKDVLCPFYP